MGYFTYDVRCEHPGEGVKYKKLLTNMFIIPMTVPGISDSQNTGAVWIIPRSAPLRPGPCVLFASGNTFSRTPSIGCLADRSDIPIAFSSSNHSSRQVLYRSHSQPVHQQTGIGHSRGDEKQVNNNKNAPQRQIPRELHSAQGYTIRDTDKVRLTSWHEPLSSST